MTRARDNADLGDSYGSLAAGVTGGSGLNAVSPANLASGVLPVGVTGGSGLTALGTVASGTLGSGVTFPAGHIIQTQYASENNSYDSSVDSWSSYATVPALTITPTHASNPIILIMSLHTFKANATNMAVDFYKNATGFTETYNLSGQAYGFGYQVSSDVQKASSHMMRDIAGTTNEITYRISYRPFNSNNATAGLNAALMSILAMEVMRD